MADFAMTYGSLETAAKQVNQAETNLGDVITFLSNAVSALEGSWEGESYEAFVGAWNESKPTMERLKDAVGKFAPELNRAVSAQQETEATNASAMSNLAF